MKRFLFALFILLTPWTARADTWGFQQSATTIGVVPKAADVKGTMANSSITDGGAGVTVGSPTGGAQGAGTINATGVYINGVAAGGGGTTNTIASGTAALGTSAIASTACATVVTATATGTLTTDTLTASFNGDPSGVVGFQPLTSGTLTIFVYPSANTANFKVCNLTAGPITPGALTLNWRVVR